MTRPGTGNSAATTTTPIRGTRNAMADGHDMESTSSVAAKKRGAGKRKWLGQPWVRALHRDFGFLVIGLTVIYAFSGLAVNHVADWDPNFQSYERTLDLG